MNLDFLGTGWSFPPTFSKNTGSVALTSGEEDIARSIEILLTTSRGERVMRSDYGCNLHDLVFEPLSTSAQTYFSEDIRNSIEKYESRIVVNDISIDMSESISGLLLISVDYTVIATHNRYNYVYPYYLESNSSES